MGSSKPEPFWLVQSEPRPAGCRGMDVVTGSATAYDEVSYPAGCFPQTHPNRLATVAFLRGLDPAPITGCRVLELGCNSGANLVPMAAELPESEFVGVDLAARPVAAGREFVNALGLRNLRLHARDLLAITAAEFGRFDYLIAHGLYSWVPAPAREGILALCQQLLAPDGVAYVSYNAYPGNHLRDLVRGMMRFHAASFTGLEDRVGQARGLLRLVAEGCRRPDYYHAAVKNQYERLLKVADPVVYHDDLSEENRPFYFFEFMADAGRHGLQFVGEASANELPPERYDENVLQILQTLEENEIVREQFKDFLRGCAFRQTVLCPQGRELAPAPLVERVPQLFGMCDATVEAQPDPGGGHVSVFRRRNGSVIETAHPLVSAALATLCSAWPCSVPFHELLRRAMADGGGVGAEPAEAVLSSALVQAHVAGFLFLHTHPHRVVNRAGERPAISRLAQHQLARGEVATNQMHTALRFPDPLARLLVQSLDGTRDRAGLVGVLARAVERGDMPLTENGQAVGEPEAVRSLLTRRVEEGLTSLAREAMLVG